MLFFPEKRKREVIEQIILEKYNQYYRLAYSYVHNEADAGDIVQNGAYRALRGCLGLKQPEFAETWVYRIMLNECFRFLKQPANMSVDAMQEEQKTGMGFVVEDTYGNIDLQRALEELSEGDRAIVILKYFEDRKLEEIADIMDENVNTIKSRLYRSLKKLREALGTESGKCKYGLESRMGR